MDEPVDIWESRGLLKAMYTGELGRCPFQLMALTTRYAALCDAFSRPEGELIITERSIFSDKELFASVNLTEQAELEAVYPVPATISSLPP